MVSVFRPRCVKPSPQHPTHHHRHLGRPMEEPFYLRCQAAIRALWAIDPIWPTNNLIRWTIDWPIIRLIIRSPSKWTDHRHILSLSLVHCEVFVLLKTSSGWIIQWIHKETRAPISATLDSSSTTSIFDPLFFTKCLCSSFDDPFLPSSPPHMIQTDISYIYEPFEPLLFHFSQFYSKYF